jgi:hypothetical protein
MRAMDLGGLLILRPRRYRPGGLLPGELSSGGLGSSDIVPDIWAPVVSLRWSGPDSFRTRRLENQRGYNEGISVPAACGLRPCCRCDQPHHPRRSSAPITQPHPPEWPAIRRSLLRLHTDLLRNALGTHHDAATLHVGINRFVRVAVCVFGPKWHSTEETYSNARPHQFDLSPQCTTPQHPLVTIIANQESKHPVIHKIEVLRIKRYICRHIFHCAVLPRGEVE